MLTGFFLENQTKTKSDEHVNDDRFDARVCSVLSRFRAVFQLSQGGALSQIN